ncbi:hypothetical protein EVAR_69563_1, partial [Eumeta japonica]
MGNRATVICGVKTNLAIKDKEQTNEHTKTKRDSKRRIKQRQLSLNCMTREASQTSQQEPVVPVHNFSTSLPRNTKLSIPENNLNTIKLESEPKPGAEVSQQFQEQNSLIATTSSETKQSLLSLSKEFSSSCCSNPVEKKLTFQKRNQKPVTTNSLSKTNLNSLSANKPTQPGLKCFSTIPSSSSTIIDVIDSACSCAGNNKNSRYFNKRLTRTTSNISTLKTSAMKFNSDLATVKDVIRISQFGEGPHGLRCRLNKYMPHPGIPAKDL